MASAINFTEAAGYQNAPKEIRVLSAIITRDVTRIAVHGVNDTPSFFSADLVGLASQEKIWPDAVKGLRNAVDLSLEMNRQWVYGALEAINKKEKDIQEGNKGVESSRKWARIEVNSSHVGSTMVTLSV